MFYVFLVIAVIFGIIYLVKISKSKKLLASAVEAHTRGDDKLAVELFKKALVYSNETPDREQEVVSYLKKIYQKHGIEFDFSDYELLMRQFRALSGKSSQKAIREMGEVNKLKTKIIEGLPEL